jgi:membrane fusion protein (multidrug efflux system)
MSVRIQHLVLIVSTGLFGCSNAESTNAGGPGGGMPPMPVEVASAIRHTVVDAIFVTGGIEAEQSIELRPEVDGRVVDILVREGSEVSAGTPLFKIDDAEIRAQVARLEAERDLARQALERTRRLIEQNASSEADLEQAESSFRVAEAQLELQQLRLERTVVRAPFSGLVGERFVSLGDYVTSSTRLVTLQTVDPQRASFQVPERYANKLELGQRVTFAVAALPDTQFTGVVEFVDPVVQLPSRTITVKARVPNPRRQLKAGMFLEARLATEVRPDAIVIPEDAVLPLQGATFVWIVTEENTARRREVELGVRVPGFVEVLEGVEAGENVVVGGLERLSDGAPVAPSTVERDPG